MQNDYFFIPLELSAIPTPVPASLLARPGQYETVDHIPATTSPQDVEPLSVYQDLESDHLTSGDLGSCGTYTNVPDQKGENLRNSATNYANVDMPSAKGNSQNKMFTNQAYEIIEIR